MRHRIPHLMCLVTCVVVLMTAAHAQPSHWAAPDDKTAKFMIDMERKWAEGVCTNNGVVSELLADDFQGTSTAASATTKRMNCAMKKAHTPRTAAHSTMPRCASSLFAKDKKTMAIIYGSEHSIGKDKAHPDAKVCQVWTDTWLKRNGKWQIAAAQDNKVDCK